MNVPLWIIPQRSEPAGLSKGQRRRWRRRLTAIERLEDRRMLSGSPLTANEEQSLLSGLNSVAQWSTQLTSDGLMGQQLPLVNESVGQVVNVASALAGVYSQLTTPGSAAFLPTNATSTAAVANSLQHLANIGNLQLTVNSAADNSSSSQQLLSFDLNITVKDTVAATADFNSLVNSSQVNFTNAANVNVQGELDLDINFGLSLQPGLTTDDAFFIQFNNLDAGATITQNNNLNLAAQVGLLGAQVQNGSFNLDAGLSGTFANPNPISASNQFTVTQLQTDIASNVVTFAPTTSNSSDLSVNLPVAASLGLKQANADGFLGCAEPAG
jgi:hypothetical protein